MGDALNILLWSEFYPPYRGGIENWTARLALAMADRGHRIAVVTSHYDLPLADVELADGIAIHRFQFHAALADSDLRTIAKILSGVAKLKRTLCPDLVHLQLQAPSAFFHMQTTAAWNCPTLSTVHGEFKDCRAGADTLLGTVFDRSAWVAAVSHAVLDDLRHVAPGTIPKSSCIYNGAELLPAAPQPSQNGGITILCGGRLVKEKGLDLLLSAFQQVAESTPAAKLVISGDGPERASLELQAEALGISRLVRFLGWIPEESLRRQMELATMVVLPSRWREGFGLYALEAMLAGTPVIAARVGALPEVIQDGVTGLIVPREDSAALRDAILKLVHNPALRMQFGAAAKQDAEARFSLDSMIDCYEALYRRLLGPSTSVSHAQ